MKCPDAWPSKTPPGLIRAYLWSAQGQSAEHVEETCGPAKSCQRMTDVGFDGLAEEADGDLRLAWRIQLAREGKLNRGAGSVRDLVLGSES